MKRSLAISLAALALLVMGGVAACGDDAPLADTSWVLESYGPQAAPLLPIGDTVITAEFDGSEATLGGSAGSNSYSAGYTIADGRPTLSALAWTERACLDPEGVMDQEQTYLTALGAATALRRPPTPCGSSTPAAFWYSRRNRATRPLAMRTAPRKRRASRRFVKREPAYGGADYTEGDE